MRIARIAAALALWPGAALANTGIGYFMVPMPVVVLALVPAIALEAWVLKALLGLGWKRGAILSLRANVVSTLYGLVAGLALDLLLAIGTGSSGFPWMRAGVAIMLVPWFAFSWWIEFRVVAKRLAELPRKAVRRATGAANTLTYALMMAFVFFGPLVPIRDVSYQRAQVTEAILKAHAARERVEQFWHAHRRLPDDPREVDLEAMQADDRFAVTLGRGGRISVEIRMPREPEIDGKHVELAPVADPGADKLRWLCGSRDLVIRYLPGGCRDQLP